MIRFWLPIAVLTSDADKPSARRRAGIRSTWICRVAPPNGNGIDAPATVASWARMNELPKSNSSDSPSLVDDSASCRIGTVEALYLSTSGGVMPDGIWRSVVCANAVTCDIARLMSTPGWKNTLMTVTPG